MKLVCLMQHHQNSDEGLGSKAEMRKFHDVWKLGVWLVRKHFLLANKNMLLARLIKIPIRTIQLQYVFICT
jgi:hypothetical protein